MARRMAVKMKNAAYKRMLEVVGTVVREWDTDGLLRVALRQTSLISRLPPSSRRYHGTVARPRYSEACRSVNDDVEP